MKRGADCHHIRVGAKSAAIARPAIRFARAYDSKPRRSLA
jgi:hypothetical protein